MSGPLFMETEYHVMWGSLGLGRDRGKKVLMRVRALMDGFTLVCLKGRSPCQTGKMLHVPYTPKF